MLAAVSIPVAVVVMGSIFTASQSRSQQQAEEQRAQAQRDVEEQRAQDEALQAYLEGMGTLLLDKGLLDSQGRDEVRTLARARTLTVLGRINADRKRSVVHFLQESGLIEKDRTRPRHRSVTHFCTPFGGKVGRKHWHVACFGASIGVVAAFARGELR